MDGCDKHSDFRSIWFQRKRSGQIPVWDFSHLITDGYNRPHYPFVCNEHNHQLNDCNQKQGSGHYHPNESSLPVQVIQASLCSCIQRGQKLFFQGADLCNGTVVIGSVYIIDGTFPIAGSYLIHGFFFQWNKFVGQGEHIVDHVLFVFSNSDFLHGRNAKVPIF